MRRVGLKIAAPGKSTSTASPDEVVVDTELETLPINQAKEWKLSVLGSSLLDDFAVTSTYIYHDLNYAPLFKAWVLVGDKKFLLPYFATNNFAYQAYSDAEKVTITTAFGTPTYTGGSFDVKGFVYILEKKFADE